jgi:molecular chaperone DnaK (HSP70)
VAFTEEDRLIGAEALSRAGNKADSVLPFASRLLGHLYNETEVHARLQKEHNPMILEETPGRHTISLQVREANHTVEEVLGMVLEHVRNMASTYGSTNAIKDCVITVDPSSTRAQRILLMQVAQAAGLNVQALLHENAAAALYYGVDRLDNVSAHLALFYNLGASKLQVSVARYSSVEVNITNANKTIENIEVLSHVSSQKVSGSLIDAQITDLLAAEFLKTHNVDLTSNKKAMLKLTNLANQAKRQLSANKVTTITAESLHQDLPFSYILTRETLDTIVFSLSEALLEPIEEAVKLAGVSISAIDSFELLGGVARIPKVQEILLTKVPALGQHLNGDEAMAHGAALFGANLTRETYVKPMWFSDILGYEVHAEFFSPDDEAFTEKVMLFDRNTQLNTVTEYGFRFDKRVLCKLTAKYPSGDKVLDLYDMAEIAEIAANFTQVPYNLFSFAVNPIGLSFMLGGYSEVEFLRADLKQAGIKLDDYPGEDPQSLVKKFRAKIHFNPFPVEQPRPLAKQQLEQLAKVLKEYNDRDEAKLKLYQAKNDLEALVVQLKEKLQEEVFQSVTTDEERTALQETLAQETQWLESPEFPQASLDTLKTRKSTLNSSVSATLKRESELRIRDSYVATTRQQLDQFTAQIQDLPDADLALTNIQAAKSWLEEMTAKQQGRALSLDPVFTTDDIKGLMTLVKNAMEQLSKPSQAVRPKEEL